jgi:SAM-dependent methyltransferase
MISACTRSAPCPRGPKTKYESMRGQRSEIAGAALAPLGRRGLAALAPHPGESVPGHRLWRGETALDLARGRSPDGAVVGIDLSAAVLAFAQRAANGSERRCGSSKQMPRCSPSSRPRSDAAFSRFGVMFFADPTAAFINIRGSLRPNGRLAFVCWRALEQTRSTSCRLGLRPLICRRSPLTTGRARPFAFANPNRVRCILERAGFVEIEIACPATTSKLEAATSMRCWRFARGSELWAKILRENPELRAATLPAVRSTLAAHDGPDGGQAECSDMGCDSSRLRLGSWRKKSAKGRTRKCRHRLRSSARTS